mgnify:CR=1 FL=1
MIFKFFGVKMIFGQQKWGKIVKIKESIRNIHEFAFNINKIPFNFSKLLLFLPKNLQKLPFLCGGEKKLSAKGGGRK